MSPIKPHWVQPSHPDIQEVIVDEAAFATKSISKISLPPFGLFAKLEFPPCTMAPEPTYATVQMDRDKHFNLNSDLLYINHSCEPSLIFDTSSMNVIAGPKGLKPGDELTGMWLNRHIRDLLEERDADPVGAPAGAQRRGPTSRELSGEMGGDTAVQA
ncbi:hypothetical protein VTH06DRAFT_1594 [Thermothelomyces fergusii]